MKNTAYTQEEIDSNLNILIHQEQELELKKIQINKELKRKRKHIKYWEQMTTRQLKAF